MSFIMDLIGRFILFLGLNDTPEARGITYLILLGSIMLLLIVMFNVFLRYNDLNALEHKVKY